MSDFFVPDTTYIRDDPYKAPEIRPEFVCVGVATHPTKKDKRAFGFYRPGRFSPWRSDAMDSTGWARGWTVTAIDPLELSWSKGVSHPDDPAEDTIVECTAADGRLVALFLDAEHREALGLQLVDPNGEMDQPCEDCTAERGELVLACKTCGAVVSEEDALASPCDHCGAAPGEDCGPECLPLAHN